ncbi:MAG TPA: Calx-beta domain-containing protein [Candidatus Angelobacter sp.]|nr:Calx-beta domain-containing protein [Candidatus Angelobacter sp.]
MFPIKLLLSAAVAAALIAPAVCQSQVNVFTYHYDNARTGENTNETLLTPANVNQSTFGKLFSYPVDGYVYAQPLYMSGLNIPGQGVHNVIFIATEHNSVYCCDADSNAGTNAGVLWQVNLGPSAPCPAGNFLFKAIVPEVGITGTPVIDPVSGTLYVDTFTVSGTNYSHQIHALSILDGSEKSFSPVTVNVSIPGQGAGSSGGTLPFAAIQELQRPALTLAGGILYVAYAGYTDTIYTDPFHGWIIGFNASDLQQLPNYIFCSTPNGASSQFGPIAGEAGIWMGGGGLAVDENTNLYFSTGDGNFNAYFGGTEYGNSVIKLSTVDGLSVADYFTTFNQAYFRSNDIDVGSGGVMLLPDQPGPYPHLMIAGGKPQRGYFMNRDQMTTDNQHYDVTETSDQILQTMALGGPSFDTPAYFNERIYYVGAHDAIRSYIVTNATLIPDQPGTFGSRIYPFPGATPSISANGTNNSIAWAIENTNGSPAILAAYDAMNLASEIYNSSQAGARDQLAEGVKFAAPIVANGKVYVGGQYSVAVFGLLGGALEFSSDNYTNQQTDGFATVTVNRIGGSTGAAQITYATTAGSAIPGQDYVDTNGTLNWPDGDTSPKSFNITLLNNPQAMTNRTIFLTLSNVIGGAYLAGPSNAVLTIAASPVSSYQAWKIAHFGPDANNAAVTADSADPDHDGIANILEYAFGSDPNLPDTNAPLVGSIQSNHFQLQFNRNTSATDLTYFAQAVPTLGDIASNLATYASGTGWITNTPGATVIESAPTGSPPDQHVQVTIIDPVDTTSMTQTQRFFELHVQP